MNKTHELEFSVSKLALRIIVFIAPIIIFAYLLYIKEANHKLYRTIIREDHLIEYLTCINYFVAFVIGIVMTKAFWNQKSTLLFSLYLFFSLCLLFFSGEEISWGQRLLQFKPPEFILNNSFQYEMNLHNLKVIRDFDYFFAAKISILIGLYGAFSWVVLAFLKAFGLDKPQNFCVPYLAPKWFLSSYFLLVAMYFFYTAYLFPRFALLNIRHREQEPMELILSLGFLLFVISNRIHQIQTNSVK